MSGPITRHDVARYPVYYLGEESPGYPVAHAARCPHGGRLTEACPGCRVVNVEPVCGPPPHAGLTCEDEIIVEPRHIAAWRVAGPGSWLVALPGQVVIRPGDRRAPGVVEIGPFERLGVITERLASGIGFAATGAQPTDHDLARACTGIAADLLPYTSDLDAWADVAETLRHAMAARGLHRAGTSSTVGIGTDIPLGEWRQSYRRSDGACAGVILTEAAGRLLVSITAWSRTATAALPPRHREGDQVAAVLAETTCRQLDGEHPGPLWNAVARDREPERGHLLWRITHAVLTQIAQVTDGSYARPGWGLADLVTSAVTGACTAAGCPASGEAWVRRQVTFWTLHAAGIPTCGPRDRRNPALLACLAHRHRPQLAQQLRLAADITAHHADTRPRRR